MGIRPSPHAQEQYFILRTGFEDEPERPCPQLCRPLPRTTTATHDPSREAHVAHHTQYQVSAAPSTCPAATRGTVDSTKYHKRHTPT